MGRREGRRCWLSQVESISLNRLACSSPQRQCSNRASLHVCILTKNGSEPYFIQTFVLLSHINEDKRKTEGQKQIFDVVYEVDGCPVSEFILFGTHAGGFKQVLLHYHHLQ